MDHQDITMNIFVGNIFVGNKSTFCRGVINLGRIVRSLLAVSSRVFYDIFT